jgi:hypothetical protein
MSIEYEYQDMDNNTPKAIPAGEYNVKVVGHEFGMSSTGKDKLTLDLHFSELDANLKADLYFTPAAAWKFDTVLKCFAPGKGKRLPGKGDRITINSAFIQEYVMDSEGKVVVVEEVYMEKKRSKVDKYLAGAHLELPGAGSGQANLLEDEEEDENVPF